MSIRMDTLLTTVGFSNFGWETKKYVLHTSDVVEWGPYIWLKEKINLNFAKKGQKKNVLTERGKRLVTSDIALVLFLWSGKTGMDLWKFPNQNNMVWKMERIRKCLILLPYTIGILKMLAKWKILLFWIRNVTISSSLLIGKIIQWTDSLFPAFYGLKKNWVFL